MIFVRKILMAITAVSLIFIGGNGTQSANTMLQGSGFLGLLIGLFILFLLAKTIWAVMGCLPSFLAICAVGAFVLYAIGVFNGGTDKIIPNIEQFIGRGKALTSGYMQTKNLSQAPKEQEPAKETSNTPTLAPTQTNTITEQAAPAPVATISENFDNILVEQEPSPSIANTTTSTAERAVSTTSAPVAQQAPQLMQPTQTGGAFGDFLDSVVSSISGVASHTQEQIKQEAFNPNNYPAITGVAKVITGDNIMVGQDNVKIFGVAAPIADQTCADFRGRAYPCGLNATRWLNSWISGYEVECRIIQHDGKGNLVGTCQIGSYDIGAALVNAGWAIADTRVIGIYVPYQAQAQAEKRGLWQGQFYKPWDWLEIKSMKPKIKIIKPKRKKKGSILDV